MDRKQALLVLVEDIVELDVLCSRARAMTEGLASDFFGKEKPDPHELVLDYPKVRAYIDIANDYVFQLGKKLEELCREGV